ncbi:hypothetical protein Clacol_002179 [Clathrus columnatus]|uniref:Protein kinase domain-containing protein n=1 Tax=Clathrus columnatus TaxID=1419009 RepID=A0AAV5A2X9_9AGAM|nr:hypothetical protein Clacol_002179 [Clathrus columnatus]
MVSETHRSSRFLKNQFQFTQEVPEPEMDEGLIEELEAKRLWGSLSWFLEKGDTLFEFSPVGYSFPLLDTPPQNGEYPYAFCGDKILFAQDSQNRHVAIKKLNKPDEIRIYRFLYEKRELLPGTCILPVLEILENEELFFAVTPRWGEDTCYPNSGTIRNVLDYLNCILKDLKEDNTLVNHFGAYRCTNMDSMRSELRDAGRLTYALFDFDLLLMLPSNDCRLPSGRSFEVLLIILPYDVAQGELDYDPYKFEMCCLGIVLCQMFQNCIPFAHFLAPFLDLLITHRLESRFTSQEALRFFEEMRSKLTPEQVSVEAPADTARGQPHWEPDKYNRWENLPEDYAELCGATELLRP